MARCACPLASEGDYAAGGKARGQQNGARAEALARPIDCRDGTGDSCQSGRDASEEHKEGGEEGASGATHRLTRWRDTK